MRIDDTDDGSFGRRNELHGTRGLAQFHGFVVVRLSDDFYNCAAQRHLAKFEPQPLPLHKQLAGKLRSNCIHLKQEYFKMSREMARYVPVHCV